MKAVIFLSSLLNILLVLSIYLNTGPDTWGTIGGTVVLLLLYGVPLAPVVMMLETKFRTKKEPSSYTEKCGEKELITLIRQIELEQFLSEKIH